MFYGTVRFDCYKFLFHRTCLATFATWGNSGDTIREMHAAFRRGGRAAIDKVMKQQPAVFLKLLVLLVPRDMRVEHSGGVKSMTDEQIEQAIAWIQAMLAARAGETAKVIEGEAEVVPSLPAPARPTKAS